MTTTFANRPTGDVLVFNLKQQLKDEMETKAFVKSEIRRATLLLHSDSGYDDAMAILYAIAISYETVAIKKAFAKELKKQTEADANDCGEYE